MSTSLLRPRIWKISHGDAEFNSEPDLRQWLEEEHLVTMNRGTLKKQGERFENGMSVGDYFYLRESGRIKLFGRIESDASYVPEQVNECFGDVDDWIARKYTVLFWPISDRKYTGELRKWTPNYNSTLGEVPEDELGLFEEWILRPFFGKTLADIQNWESGSIRRETAIMDYALNTILYGPPGTGKTYNVVNYAVAIADRRSLEDVQAEDYINVVLKRYDELKKQGRIAFTTFHQSYGYEDFIEGIRPILKNGANGDGLIYEHHHGEFRDFCEKARRNLESSKKTRAEQSREDAAIHAIDSLVEKELETKESGRRLFKTINGTEFLIVGADKEHVNIFIPKNLKWKDVDLSREELSKIVAADRDFSGPKEVRDYLKQSIRAHDSYLFALNKEVRSHLSQSSNHFTKEDELPFVFIIDEINRGNISKIFGELITLIEPNKRLGADEETKAILPYSGEEFGVPKNVYILGTMNTADRSIALLDTALRRRFDFIEMMPRPDLLTDIHVVKEEMAQDDYGVRHLVRHDAEIKLAIMLQKMNDRIEFLLDREHTIGHAYFMGDFQKNPTLDGLADIFRNKIVPLLQEYFFDDYSKIRLVLGDNAKPWDDQFVQEETNHASLFAGTPIDIDLDKPTYRINPGAFDRVEAYTGIYA